MSIATNFLHNSGRNYTDSTSSRHSARFYQRGGPRYSRPQSNRGPNNFDDVDTLMVSINRDLTTDGNPTRQSLTTRSIVHRGRGRGRDQGRRHPQPPIQAQSQTGWWRITIPQAGTIGKERVMSSLKAHCTRQFQPYHYFIDPANKSGVFFVNSQHDADMIKRTNGKIEVQNLDILRIMVSRVSGPVPSLDEDVRPHFKDHLLNHRFNHQTFQLDLANLADDEELSSLGVFPQFNRRAFIRDVVEIINKDLPTVRILDLGSNNIVNLDDFRNLRLDNLVQLSLASNQLKNVDDFENLKQLPCLTYLLIKNNPLTSPNNKRTTSISDITSAIQKKLPQLKQIDGIELRPIIGFGTDIQIINLPKSVPHYVPNDMQDFLTNFIKLFFQLFDKNGREELHACYHDSCMFSLSISTSEGSIVQTRQYRYGPLLYDSRNLLKVVDNNKRMSLLRHGKTAVMDFLKVKFPATKHDGNSFHVDVISTANNRAMFTVSGLYQEMDQSNNPPVRCFQRTFTCASTATGVLIIADHIMLTNSTDAQVSNMNRSSISTASAPQTTTNHSSTNSNVDLQNQMIQAFSQQSGMNVEYSKLCLEQNNWDYNKAAAVFLDSQKNNLIPQEAFNKS